MRRLLVEVLFILRKPYDGNTELNTSFNERYTTVRFQNSCDTALGLVDS